MTPLSVHQRAGGNCSCSPASSATCKQVDNAGRMGYLRLSVAVKWALPRVGNCSAEYMSHQHKCHKLYQSACQPATSNRHVLPHEKSDSTSPCNWQVTVSQPSDSIDNRYKWARLHTCLDTLTCVTCCRTYWLLATPPATTRCCRLGSSSRAHSMARFSLITR